MIEALQFEFMRNALAAGILASIICGTRIRPVDYVVDENLGYWTCDDLLQGFSGPVLR
jgi:hypothetical protein